MKLTSIGLIKSIFSFLAIIMALNVHAQNATLRGRVTDANGLPLAGASVTIQGTTRGAVTDENGNYSFFCGTRQIYSRCLLCWFCNSKN